MIPLGVVEQQTTGAVAGQLVFTPTAISINTSSANFHAGSCDNHPFVTRPDGRVATCGQDGDPVGGHTGDREPCAWFDLPPSYNGGAFSINPISGGTGAPEPTLDGIDGDTFNGMRGKTYAFMRIGSTYLHLMCLQPSWPSNNGEQFENVRLVHSTDLRDWFRTGDVDWPLAQAAARGFAGKFPSVVGGDNIGGLTRDGYFYYIAAGETPDPGDNDFLSSDDLMLMRSPDSLPAIEDINNFEFLAGYDDLGNPIWSNQFGDWIAIQGLSGTLVNHWVNFIDYFSEVGIYLLWRNRRPNPDINQNGTATALEILWARNPWGPWSQLALFDPWLPFGATASNRYIFTWTVPHAWNSALVVDQGSGTWSLTFVLAYSGRRPPPPPDLPFDGLNTTDATLSGTFTAAGSGGPPAPRTAGCGRRSRGR